MNERIFELAHQAGFNTFWNGAHIVFDVSTKENMKEFAELLIKECMDAVGDGPMERPAIQRIKAKFGVEYYEPIEKAFRS
jgi:hypothetical protein